MALIEFSDKRRSAGAARVRADLQQSRGISALRWARRSTTRFASVVFLMVWATTTWIISWGGEPSTDIVRYVLSDTFPTHIISQIEFKWEPGSTYMKALRDDIERDVLPIYQVNADFNQSDRIREAMRYVIENYDVYMPHTRLQADIVERGLDERFVVPLLTAFQERNRVILNPQALLATFNDSIASTYLNARAPAISEKNSLPSHTFVHLQDAEGEQKTAFDIRRAKSPNMARIELENAMRELLRLHLSRIDDKDRSVSEIISLLSDAIPEALYLDAETQSEINRRIDERLSYKPGDVLVQANQKISRDALLKLGFHDVKKLEKETTVERIHRVLGNAGIVGVVLFVFVLWVSRTEPDFKTKSYQMFLFSVPFLLAVALARWIYIHPEMTLQSAQMSVFITPVAALAMIATMVFNERISLAVMIMLSSLIMLVCGSDFKLLLVFAGGGIVASMMAATIRDRLKVLSIGVVSGFAQVVLISLVFISVRLPSGRPNLTDPYVVERMLSSAAGAWASSFFGAIIILGLLPLIEPLFGILTRIRLFELADASHPAQRKIALEASGTYTHTLSVMSLVEAGAEAIGADALLAKVGTLYHDLGKTVKPEYFVENSLDASARHSKLSPQMSTLIIVNHVKDGIEMAREYGLPKQIIDFIPEHHGTTRIEFFYHKALENAPDPSFVKEEFFRYTGPKPQSRETGILMLADTVEAASRTLDKPNPSSLRKLVHKLIINKLEDDQLDECDITFRELKIIEDTFVNLLIARYHSRIKYPDQREQKQKIKPNDVKKEPDAAVAHPAEPNTPMEPPKPIPLTQDDESMKKKGTSVKVVITPSKKSAPAKEEPIPTKVDVEPTTTATPAAASARTLSKDANGSGMKVYLELRINSNVAPAISRAGWNRLFNSAIPFAKVLPEYPDSPEAYALKDGEKAFEVHVLLTNDAEIEKLNVRYLDHKGATDVLAFDQQVVDPETGRFVVGQIVISADTARKQASARNIDFEEELRRYALHGWLHLLGYSDKTSAERDAMTVIQEQLLKDDHRISDAAPTA